MKTSKIFALSVTILSAATVMRASVPIIVATPGRMRAAMNLVTAAHALGFAANWITEWYAYDRRVLDALGVGANEKIAGFVHIGHPTKPPEDRPRPPLSEIVTRYRA